MRSRHLAVSKQSGAESAGTARIGVFRFDKGPQDGSSSLGPKHDVNRTFPGHFVHQDPTSDPARDSRIRELVSMLHHPSHKASAGRGRKQPPGGEAPGDQGRHASGAGAAAPGLSHRELLENLGRRPCNIQRRFRPNLHTRVLQSWEQMTTDEEQESQSWIDLEKEGIASGDFNKSWVRVQDISDHELTRNAPVDRNGVCTHQIKTSSLDSPEETRLCPGQQGRQIHAGQ